MVRVILLLILFILISLFGASIIYNFAKWINRPPKSNGINAIIPVYSATNDIEQQVRFYSFGKNIDRIILLNMGAAPDTDNICKVLSRQNELVFYCSSIDDIGTALNS